MELLNQKLDRAVEAAKIKPAAKLKEMQNNEKLVAVNERIEEAMNYRKELKEFEVLEAERVERLRQENADKQRRTLQATQKKELMQLEAKIETERHNMKIKMDKDLVVLQKQINLHVHDIERIQGFVSRLAIKKGELTDELRRTKEKARKTMKQLKVHKAIGGEKALDQKASMGKTNMTTTTQAFVEGSPIDVLLFGFKNKKNIMMTSFN